MRDKLRRASVWFHPIQRAYPVDELETFAERSARLDAEAEKSRALC
jgi:hypothetical protein